MCSRSYHKFLNKSLSDFIFISVSQWVSQWVTSIANDRSRVLLYTGSDQPISSSVCLFLTLVAQQLFISSARSLIAIPSHTDFLLIHPPQQTPPHPTTLCQITPVLSNNCNCKTGSHSTHLVAETGHKWKQLGTTWPPPDWGRDLKKRFFIGISLNKGGAPKHAKICFFCLEKRLFGKKWQKVS